jgi:uncharacterized protein
MNHWPFWLGGIALAGVAITHWVLLQRMFAVSGRLTALVNRVREGRTEPETDAMTPEELALAMRELTAAEFGADALETPVVVEPPKPRTPISTSLHLVFFGSIVVGGFLSALLAGTFHPSFHLDGQTFSRLLPGPWGVLALVGGGAMVGFGTRMAGGCTSGHGLCGTSRFQPGSLVATATFFGAAVLVSFALGAFR